MTGPEVRRFPDVGTVFRASDETWPHAARRAADKCRADAAHYQRRAERLDRLADELEDNQGRLL